MKFRYEDLTVGEDILKYNDLVRKLTEKFPSDERYELTRQLRRVATSIYLNIAEGSAKNSKREFARFITISLGSLVETHASFKMAFRMGYITDTHWRQVKEQTQTIWSRLCALRDSQTR